MITVSCSLTYSLLLQVVVYHSFVLLLPQHFILTSSDVAGLVFTRSVSFSLSYCTVILTYSAILFPLVMYAITSLFNLVTSSDVCRY